MKRNRLHTATNSQPEKFVYFRLEYIAAWSQSLPPGNINLSWRKCKRKRACVAKVRNFGEALTNDAKHPFHTTLLSASAVPAQFRICFISLSAVAEWKEADKLLFTCKHDTEFACSFRTACCFVKFIIDKYRICLLRFITRIRSYKYKRTGNTNPEG